MQRIVSGEGSLSKQCSVPDQDLKEASTNLEHNNLKNYDSVMSHSSTIAIDHGANFVENDSEMNNEGLDGVTMHANDSLATFSESSVASPCLEAQKPDKIPVQVSQAHDSGLPSLSKTDRGITTSAVQQQQTTMSIISGLLPPVGLRPITRNDSRNSGTTNSFGSGLQRSQNSSRDWGWFEDVHHSDQSVTGSTISGGTRPGGNSNGERMTVEGSVANSVASRISSPQHQLSNKRAGNIINNSDINTSNNDNGGTNTNSVDGGEHNYKVEEVGGTANNETSSRNNRPSVRDRGDTNINTKSLLPTGDEMLIDDMQEYLEPIVINSRPRDMENEAAVQAVTAPNYVLEESLSNQLLWKKTAGNRPPQPVEERAFFEAQWAENFAMSEVKYRMPAEVLTATTPVSLNPFADGNFGSVGTSVAEVGGAKIGDGNHHDVADIVSSFVVPGGTSGHGTSAAHHNPHLQKPHRVVRSSSGSGRNLIVYAKGDNVFGTTVSKSFPRPSINGELVSGVNTLNISIASYRVVESEKCGKHAQFLVIFREGGIRDTIGVWKRYSDFQELSKKVTRVHEGCASVIANMSPLAITEEHDVEHLPNAITSWHLLKKRKRWYRCLDSGYLSLKAFLLERFLHDILFESSTPDLLRNFVGVPPPR